MDLYYPPRPKSKLEEYNLKLKERELYTNNILDRFTQNGNGAPIRDEQGNIITKRKAVLENIKHLDDISQNQQANLNKKVNNKENEKYNNNYEQYEYEENEQEQEEINDNIHNDNKSLENSLGQRQLISQNKSQRTNYNNPLNLVNNSQIKYNSEEKEEIKNNDKKDIEINENDYQGIGIIPRVSDFQQIKKKMRLDSIQEDLAKAIEEKKIKAERERKKQIELDLKEDLKVKKAVEEEQRLLKLEKKKKEEEENRLMMINLQNIEKNKKKKKLIDIDEYYGKDFRLFQKNRNKVNRIDVNEDKQNENATNELNEGNYTSNTNNEYEISNNMININNLRQQNQTKIDTLNAINNFTINVHKNRHILENDLKKLKKEVRNQYLEMNDLFQQLKDTEAEEDFVKNSLLQKSQLLKRQLLQSKIKNTLVKNIINQKYDENMNVNAEELEVKNNPNLISHNSNLPGTSDFLYFNEDNNSLYDMSSLAKVGKNIIELKGEEEMILINEDNKRNEEFKNNNNFYYDMNSEEYLRKKQFYEDIHKECKMEDLYKDLEDIENINKKLAPINIIQTLKNNFSVDYERLLKKEKKTKETFKNKL